MSESEFRAIFAPDWVRPTGPFEPGAAPMLQWVPVTQLGVDEAYQRPIAGRGRANVVAIAEHFNWSKFAPLIVAPVAGGLYAIIDGQHRATAAAARGVESLPAMVVIADRQTQAKAFTAINAGATRVNQVQLHRARVAAGDARALEVDAICRGAEVTVTYGQAKIFAKPGQTRAVDTLFRCLSAYGPETLSAALRAITGTRNNLPGAIGATAVMALCLVFDGRRDWRDAGDAMIQAMNRVDLGALASQAARDAFEQTGVRGDRAHDGLARLLRAQLGPMLGEIDPVLLHPAARGGGRIFARAASARHGLS